MNTVIGHDCHLFAWQKSVATSLPVGVSSFSVQRCVSPYDVSFEPAAATYWWKTLSSSQPLALTLEFPRWLYHNAWEKSSPTTRRLNTLYAETCKQILALQCRLDRGTKPFGWECFWGGELTNLCILYRVQDARYPRQIYGWCLFERACPRQTLRGEPFVGSEECNAGLSLRRSSMFLGSLASRLLAVGGSLYSVMEPVPSFQTKLCPNSCSTNAEKLSGQKVNRKHHWGLGTTEHVAIVTSITQRQIQELDWISIEWTVDDGCWTFESK